MTQEQKELFSSLTDEQVAALTVYGEARGEKMRGKFAVAFVLKNRSDLWKKTLKDVCLQRGQFSCFIDGDPNLPKLVAIAADFEASLCLDVALKNCLLAVQGVLSGSCLSNVGKATFYKVTDYPSPWFRKMIERGRFITIATVGNHTFYEEVQS